jgi:hypothetical protein
MARSRVTNGYNLLPNIDNRTLWVRRFRDLIALHTTDLGGEDVVTEGEKALIRRAACLMVELERLEMLFADGQEELAPQFKHQGRAGRLHRLDVYQRVSNTLRRTLEALGLQRRAKDVTPTLDQYLRDRKKRNGRDHDVIEGEVLE